MKIQLVIVSILLMYSNLSFGQCTVDSFVEDNYLTDAWTMVFREFAEDPSNPDYNNLTIDPARTEPYLEQLSAVYSKAATNIIVDSIFNKFNIHASQAYREDIAFGKITFDVFEGSVPWLSDFIDTGISGNPVLDQLMSDYEFTITDVGIVEPPPVLVFTIESEIPYLNHFALLDDFSAIEGIGNVQPGLANGFNYTGIPYIIDDQQVKASNIERIANGLRFTIHKNRCGYYCPISKGWDVIISEDCSEIIVNELIILNNPEFLVTNFNIYPNPVNNTLTIEANNFSITTVTIFSASGKKVMSIQDNARTVDVSTLPSGLYFIEFVSSEGQKYIHKVLKK